MAENAVLKELCQRNAESADLDFKSNVDPTNLGDVLELIKDVAALANFGGGTILIGLNNDGSPSGADVSAICALDPADLTNQIHKYTGTHFHDFEIVPTNKDGAEVCALRVRSSRVPLVFTRVGTYETTPAKQKTAFSVGTIYYRHGAKSEPCTSDDIRGTIERELEQVRRSWLDGIAKVVEAPTGARIAVLPPEEHIQSPSGAKSLRLTTDANAPAYYAVPIDETHPFRQKEVMREVNAKLAGRKYINSRDILCIRRVFPIEDEISFCFKQKYASPRYSQAFVDWLIQSYENDNEFFENTKREYDRIQGDTT